MKSKLLALTMLLSMAGWAAAGATQDKIASALLAKMEQDVSEARAAGAEPPVYRIVVDLRPVEAPADLARAFATAESEDALRANIRAAQDRVLGTLGTESRGFSVWNRYRVSYGFSAYADASAIQALAGQADVAYVQEMPIYQRLDTQAHAITSTDDAHIAGYTGAGVTIAIVDDGIDHDHPAFGGESGWPNSKILGGHDYADRDNDPRVDCLGQSHGTSVTGVAAGNGGGIVGVAKDAKVVFLKVQSSSLCGSRFLDGDVRRAIDWAVNNRNNFNPPIRIISLSLGANDFSSPCPGAVEAPALIAARNAGMVTLIAAGNSVNSNGISTPACHSDAVSVGATYDANIGSMFYPGRCFDPWTFADQIPCYSNSDSFLDLLAPSNCATTARVGGGTDNCFGGTSSATPYAAGVTALLFEKDPSLTRSAAINALKDGGVNITDPRNGVTTPRVNALASLALVVDRGDEVDMNCRGSIHSVSVAGCISSGGGELECQAVVNGGSGLYNYWWMYEGPGHLYQTNSSIVNITECLDGEGELKVQVLDRQTQDTCRSGPFRVVCDCTPGSGDLCDVEFPF